MTAFTLDPWPWVEPSVLVDSFDSIAQPGIFHVTTQVDILEKTRMMRSRAQLRHLGIEGLGGDERQSPHLVSTVYDLDQAKMLWGAMRTVCRAVQGLISTTDMLKAAIQWMEFPDAWLQDDIYIDYDDEEYAEAMERQAIQQVAYELSLDVHEDGPDSVDVEPLMSTEGWLNFLDTHAEELNRHYGDGRARYYLLQALEQVILREFPDAFRDHEADLIVGCKLVGFVAPFDKFARVQPDQISIVQLSVRVGATVEYIPDESELRFHPNDLRIEKLRLEETGPLVLPPRQDEEDDGEGEGEDGENQDDDENE